MKRIIPTLLIAVTLQLNASDPSHLPKVKVYKNDLKKIYTVFFADVLERTIKVGLQDKNGNFIIEETITGKGFSKAYGLSKLGNGHYNFVIEYDESSISEPIELRNRKKVIEESITLKNDYPTLTVNVTKYNMDPMNIMIYNLDDELLKIYYWEPTDGHTQKTINLSVFEGYEVRVYVVQDGEDKLEQLVQLY